VDFDGAPLRSSLNQSHWIINPEVEQLIGGLVTAVGGQ
jgi:hypothetical protein